MNEIVNHGSHVPAPVPPITQHHPHMPPFTVAEIEELWRLFREREARTR
jgi:hypothetical protein